MSKQVWKDLGALSGGPRPQQSQEFGPEVAHALAQLRSDHGLTNASCQSEGNSPQELDALRRELGIALPGVNRRGFLQLTGASAVFALAGCYHHDPDTLVPYAQQPEGTTLGKPVYYSSTLRDSGRPVGVMVKTYDGRPIKLEGNPDHPHSRGRLDLRTQAAVLNLYDPDRVQTGPKKKSGAAVSDIAWEVLDKEIGEALKSGNIGLLTGPIDGPASRQLLNEFIDAFGGRVQHAAYDAYAADAAVKGRGLAFGSGESKPPVYHVDRATVLVTLGSDFLGGGQTGLAEMVEFGDFRRLKGKGKETWNGQVISFEPTMSQIGSNSDLRIRASMDKQVWVAWGIAEVVAKKLGVTLPSAAQTALNAARGKSLEVALDLTPVGPEFKSAIEYTADQLIAAKKAGKNSLVYVGGASQSGANSVPLYVAACFLNAILGNEGVTVDTASNPETGIAASHKATRDLLDACAKGEITALIVVGANPALGLPAEAKPALAKVKTVVVIGDRADETFAATTQTAYLAPDLHGLENWGDAEARAGVFSLQQPCIYPLWDNRAGEESLMAFATAAVAATELPESFKQKQLPADPKLVSVISRKALWQAAAHGIQSWQNYLKAVWLKQVKPRTKAVSDDRPFWNGALAQGVVVVAPAKSPAAVTFNPVAVEQAQPVKWAASTPGQLQLVLNASRNLRDGASLNNAWLQETPDPVSQITWDNYLAMSVADARQFGFELPRYDTNWQNPVVKLTVGGASVLMPVHLQEGTDPGTIELFLGWGRGAFAGKVAEHAGPDKGDVNAFALQGAGAQRWGLAATIEPAGTTYRLACTQGHNTMDGREIALDDVLELHRQDPAFAKREHEKEEWVNGTDGKEGGRLSMWNTTHTYPGRRWGMAVDLTTCIACQACVVACQAENNVPVVGRDEVRKGRQMHWIRVDRYYSGSGYDDVQDVEVINQPVMCQQCGNAPCEEVCPAMATMHNDEGINIQIYNRCIGTRYCSNNCPYKVRRFNFYEYSKYRFGPHGSGAPFDRVVKNLAVEHATSSQDELSKAPLQMLLNPVITLRSKGVMEKCNFCIQRTRDVREAEKLNNRKYVDGAIKTACAQTCPTGAITFGDINDSESEVSKVIAASEHGYKLLDKELNTRPTVTYLRKVRNRPASAEEAKKLGHGEGGEKAEAKPATEAKPAAEPKPAARADAKAEEGKQH